MKLLMATSNRGKLGEVRALLTPHGIEVVGLGDLDEAIEIVEDADTFEGNARKKALTLFRATGLPVLADDSGLTVKALDGAPGVYSARFAGEDATDAANKPDMNVIPRITASRREPLTIDPSSMFRILQV